MFENITLTGINGQPTITAKNPLRNIHLFDDDVIGTQINSIHFTIHVENIWFARIGIVSVKKALPSLIVDINNSTISELMHQSTVSIIDSLAIRTKIFIKNSLLRNVMKGVCLKSAQSEFQMVNSELLHDEQKNVSPECPQLIVSGGRGLISAHFIRSRFKRIFLINLKSTEETRSNINIINSVFDDERISDCSSHMRINNGTILIANSSFANIVSKKQLIYISSSHVVLQRCIFRDIRSLLSPLAMSLKSVALICDCQFENNSGLNGAAIHASSNSVLNINQCVFKSNSVRSQGGALMLKQTLNTNVSECLFIDNHAEDEGGAIYYRGNTVFEYHNIYK